MNDLQGSNANCGVEDKTVINGLHRYASDQYGLLFTVGGVSGDFSQTVKCRVNTLVSSRFAETRFAETRFAEIRIRVSVYG